MEITVGSKKVKILRGVRPDVMTPKQMSEWIERYHINLKAALGAAQEKDDDRITQMLNDLKMDEPNLLWEMSSRIVPGWRIVIEFKKLL